MFRSQFVLGPVFVHISLLVRGFQDMSISGIILFVVLCMSVGISFRYLSNCTCDSFFPSFTCFINENNLFSCILFSSSGISYALSISIILSWATEKYFVVFSSLAIT